MDEDDRVEGLAAFLHVAQASDEFGFDLLGWMPVVPRGELQPLLLEVKNSKDRGFIVSAAEWRTAERERGDYAFLIVLRGAERPVGMELLPDPAGLLGEGRLTRREDGWVVGYGVTREG